VKSEPGCSRPSSHKQHWSEFEQKYRNLQQHSEKLASIAAGGDEVALKTQFGETAKTCKSCKSCHDDFLEKE